MTYDTYTNFRKVAALLRVCSFLALLAAIAACTPVASQNNRNGNFINKLPESVVTIAAPHQDLQSVVILPEDGCYWYQHVGPVETTMLPLRTVEGRPICTGLAPVET
jgi:prolipoprotein diacylglyceryltransferase